MAIDEIESKADDNTTVIDPTKNSSDNGELDEDDSLLKSTAHNKILDIDSSKLNKLDDHIEVDDDIIFLQSDNLKGPVIVIDDDNDEKTDHLGNSESMSIMNEKTSSSSSFGIHAFEEKEYNSLIHPRVKSSSLRQYGRKLKKTTINLNENENHISQEAVSEKNTINVLSDLHVTEEHDINMGLKSLLEIPDFTLSSSSRKSISVSSELESDFVEGKSRETNVSCGSDASDNGNYNAKSTQEKKRGKQPANKNDEQVQQQLIKPETIESYLKDIFKSNITGDKETQRTVIKMNDDPIIISEKGIVTVIYKPEKVKLRRENENFGTSDTRFEEENQQERKIKRRKRKHPPIKKVKFEGEMVFKCTYCDFNHDKDESAVRRHMLIHQSADSIEWFHCYLCDYRAKRKGNLKVHLILHRNPDEVVWYKCETCDKKFKHRNGLKCHEKRHIQREELEQYLCDKCSYKSPFKHTLLRHKAIHDPPDKKKLLRCKMCSYTTYNKYYLSRHRQTHGEPLYKCLLCDYQGKYKVNLESHMKKHFPQEDLLFCDSCDYKTNRKYSLTCHNRKVHNIYNSEENQTLYCYNCTFQTRFKRCLVKHMPIHCKEPGSDLRLKRIKTEKATP